MLVQGRHYRTIWLAEDNDRVIRIIDQRYLPHRFVIEEISSVAGIIRAIKEMHVRGAGLIGATAGYGMYLAAREAAAGDFDQKLAALANALSAARPTAVNLTWAVSRQITAMKTGKTLADKIAIARATARQIADEDAGFCQAIGRHGLPLIEEISLRQQGAVVNILTHCNAGWLAFTDYGTATAPVYQAFDKGIKVHVWVDETRPRNQGASLTAWELQNHGVPHTVIADNTGGHLMQKGLVDIVITGADRVTRTGDVANKIGTYLKALAARDNAIPFYVALPSSTIDWQAKDGQQDIPIEERDGDEVKYIRGLHNNELINVLLTPAASPAANYGFDITPARLISGLITERGICAASEPGLTSLFPEQKNNHD